MNWAASWKESHHPVNGIIWSLSAISAHFSDCARSLAQRSPSVELLCRNEPASSCDTSRLAVCSALYVSKGLSLIRTELPLLPAVVAESLQHTRSLATDGQRKPRPTSSNSHACAGIKTAALTACYFPEFKL